MPDPRLTSVYNTINGASYDDAIYYSVSFGQKIFNYFVDNDKFMMPYGRSRFFFVVVMIAENVMDNIVEWDEAYGEIMSEIVFGYTEDEFNEDRGYVLADNDFYDRAVEFIGKSSAEFRANVMYFVSYYLKARYGFFEGDTIDAAEHVFAVADNSRSSSSSSVSRPSYSSSSSSYSTSTYVDEGSAAVGVILVLFLNWIGLVIAIITKKRKTTKSAIITLVVEIGLGIFLGILFFVLVYLKIIDLEALKEMIESSSSSYGA